MPAPDRQLQVVNLPVTSLDPNPRNARTHSKRQSAHLKAAMLEFGFTNPILVDERLQIIAGHGRHTAVLELGTTVPCIQLSGLSAAQENALAIADNKLSDMSTFDLERLGEQLRELCAVNFQIELTGFETAEVDILLELPTVGTTDPADVIPNMIAGLPVARPGDLWRLNRNSIICETALKTETYEKVLNGSSRGRVFGDPPYNLAIGDVSGSDAPSLPIFSGQPERCRSRRFRNS